MPLPTLPYFRSPFRKHCYHSEHASLTMRSLLRRHPLEQYFPSGADLFDNEMQLRCRPTVVCARSRLYRRRLCDSTTQYSARSKALSGMTTFSSKLRSPPPRSAPSGAKSITSSKRELSHVLLVTVAFSPQTLLRRGILVLQLHYRSRSHKTMDPQLWQTGKGSKPVTRGWIRTFHACAGI